jgi:hypothetical protein
MARFGDLTDVLSGLGEKQLQIQKAIIVKFGNLTIAEMVVPKDSEFPITEEEAMATRPFEFRGDVVSSIHAALKDHPNVFDPETIYERSESRCGDQFGFFVHGTVCQYRIHLPRAKQKYKDEMDCEEHFSVLCDGSTFAAYAEVQDIPVWSNIGHEFRELATAQIEKETPFSSPSLGPCPIHPDIVIVVRDPADGDAEIPARRYHQGDDIFIVTSDRRPIAELVLDCFLDFRGPVEDFYELLSGRDHLIDSYVEVSNHFSAASKSTRELLETPSWNIWKTHVASRVARISIASVHARLVELETELMNYTRNRSNSLENLRKHREASPLHDYFREITESDVSLPSSLVSALTFFESELQFYGNIRSLLYASLLGAVVGSLLTGLVSRLVR